MSQNPDTKEYIMVFNKNNGKYCKKCYKKYTNVANKWCKPCQLNTNLKTWIIKNEKVNNLVQLKIDGYYDIMFEWIPYNRFYDIEEIRKGSLYSAIWKDGPLEYDMNKRKYKRNNRNLNKKVALKYLQIITGKILDKV